MVRLFGAEYSIDATRVIIRDNEVEGTIPSEIGLFAKLTYLEIGKTQITGTMPAEIGNLSALENILIYETPLNGMLPTEVFGLVKLSKLWILKTLIEGPISPHIGNLVKLTSLILRDNLLSGEIPPEVGRLQDLEECFLNGNALNGSLPTTVGDLGVLSFLDVNNNTLSGVLPSALGRLRSLVQFQGQLNGFSGEIPKQLLSLPNLKSLYLHSNRLSSFPNAIAGSKELQSLRLQDNELQGQLPDGLETLAGLTLLALHNNHLTSSLPESLGALLNLKRLEIQDNDFSGSFPDLSRLQQLTLLKARGNAFTGPLPILPTSVQRLDLADNLLRGNISRITELEQLRELRISLNAFTGDLQALVALPVLRTLDARDNHFSGHFPILPASTRSIDLTGNNLSGRLNGTMFNSLQRLNTLSLGNNRLSGLDNVALPVSLRKLEIHDNLFKGSIPQDIFELDRLSVLALHGNKWEPESLTPRVTNLEKLRRLSVGVEVVCDCNLLSWYTPFVNVVSSIKNKAEVARCSPANTFGGTHPHLLTIDDEAPCTHARVADVTSTSTSLNITWHYNDSRIESYLTGEEGILDILDPSDRVLFAAGAHVMSTNNALHGAYAFELEWSDFASSSGFSRKFVDAKEVQVGTGMSVYNDVLPGLLPNRAYNIRIRPLRLLQQDSLPAAYVYGPGSSLPTQTKEDLPSGGVANVRAVELEATRITVTWDVPEETQRNGRIVEYLIEVWDGQDVRVLDSESNTKIVPDLEPENVYAVRVLAGTTRGFGNDWSDFVNVSTCRLFSRWSNESSLSGDCEAIRGRYRNEFDQFASCAELTRDFSDALQNECKEVGVNVQTLPLGRGYWRASLDTSSLYPCPNPGWCEGSVEGRVDNVDAYCVDNHTGAFCFSCITGYVQSHEGCIRCTPDHEIEATTTVGLFFLLYLIIFAFYAGKILVSSGVLHMCLQRRRAQRSRPRNRRKSLLQGATSSFTKLNIPSLRESMRSYNTAKVRILFGFLQVYFAYRKTFFASKYSSSAELVTLDFVSSSSFALVLDSFSVRCGYDMSPYAVLLLTTLLPMLFILLLACMRLALAKAYTAFITPVKREFTWSVLSFLFLIYPSVSRTVLETFWCIQVEGMAEPLLRVDYHTTCSPTTERIGWVIYAGLMVIIYPAGVILLYSALLHSFAPLIKKNKEELDSDEVQRLAQITFLISPYKSRTYWFEAYELLRKLLQTSLIGFLLPWVPPENLNVVAVVSQNLCMLAIGVMLYTQPYKLVSDFAFALVSLALLLLNTQFTVVDPYEPIDTIFILVLEIVLFFLFSLVDVYCMLITGVGVCYLPAEDVSRKRVQANPVEEARPPVETPSLPYEMNEFALEGPMSPASSITIKSVSPQQEGKLERDSLVEPQSNPKVLKASYESPKVAK